jgi:hypothetical protein
MRFIGFGAGFVMTWPSPAAPGAVDRNCLSLAPFGSFYSWLDFFPILKDCKIPSTSDFSLVAFSSSSVLITK